MKEQIYVDSNVFVYAATNTEIIGIFARQFLDKIKKGEIDGTTSILTIDEVLWVVQKLAGRAEAYKVASAILLFPNLVIVDVTKNIIAEALQLYQTNSVQPQDAIHLATMQFKNTKTIISNDSDFDKIKNIRRIKLD